MKYRLDIYPYFEIKTLKEIVGLLEHKERGLKDILR